MDASRKPRIFFGSVTPLAANNRARIGETPTDFSSDATVVGSCGAMFQRFGMAASLARGILGIWKRQRHFRNFETVV